MYWFGLCKRKRTIQVDSWIFIWAVSRMDLPVLDWENCRWNRWWIRSMFEVPLRHPSGYMSLEFTGKVQAGQSPVYRWYLKPWNWLRERGADILGLICGTFQQLKFEERRLRIYHLSRKENERILFRGIQVKKVFLRS